ncbi:MAG: TPM domain-containing protein [Flavobacterium sp.]|uniref:TPM domain-containing protein n=1 Tax=Flavobacterium sp. TaxID=239 RepID=UPI002B49F148|nr:TPM domain-containing protein [Flavobacterium sp.]WRH74316.1 MAG: TPM domain-containing protein [Flavobacterium sp.]
MRKLFLFVLVLTGIVAQAQFTIPDRPSFQTSVYDYADILNPLEEKELENKLIRYSDSTTTQIVLITIEDLKGEDIGILTPRWGQTWGIGGSEQNDNGIIILFAKNDKKIWISPGYGVEDRLTAGINGQLIRNIIIPEFKAGNFYLGLDKGTDAIFEVLKGKYKGSRKESSNPLPFILIVVFVIILLVLASRGNKGGGNFRGGSGLDLGDIIILSSLGRGNGGFGGGGSSGGFGGGFGGGGFSGGGAGGSW